MANKIRFGLKVENRKENFIAEKLASKQPLIDTFRPYKY